MKKNRFSVFRVYLNERILVVQRGQDLVRIAKFPERGQVKDMRSLKFWDENKRFLKFWKKGRTGENGHFSEALSQSSGWKLEKNINRKII